MMQDHVLLWPATYICSVRRRLPRPPGAEEDALEVLLPDEAVPSAASSDVGLDSKGGPIASVLSGCICRDSMCANWFQLSPHAWQQEESGQQAALARYAACLANGELRACHVSSLTVNAS